MVEVKVIGSSSKGNGYLLSDGERSLLLEAGINLKWYKAIDFSRCDACLITHEHDDHAKFAQAMISNSGMDVYLSAGTQGNDSAAKASDAHRQGIGRNSDRQLDHSSVSR